MRIAACVLALLVLATPPVRAVLHLRTPVAVPFTGSLGISVAPVGPWAVLQTTNAGSVTLTVLWRNGTAVAPAATASRTQGAGGLAAAHDRYVLLSSPSDDLLRAYTVDSITGAIAAGNSTSIGAAAAVTSRPLVVTPAGMAYTLLSVGAGTFTLVRIPFNTTGSFGVAQTVSIAGCDAGVNGVASRLALSPSGTVLIVAFLTGGDEPFLYRFSLDSAGVPTGPCTSVSGASNEIVGEAVAISMSATHLFMSGFTGEGGNRLDARPHSPVVGAASLVAAVSEFIAAAPDGLHTYRTFSTGLREGDHPSFTANVQTLVVASSTRRALLATNDTLYDLRSTALFVYPRDVVTLPPRWLAPLSTVPHDGTLVVSFELPEVPFPGSVILTLANATSGFVAAIGFTNMTTFRVRLPLSRVDQLASTFVASAMAPDFIPPGTYNTSLCYRDDLNNTAACTLVSDVYLADRDRVTTPPRWLAPPSSVAACDRTLPVSFELPEPPFPGSVTIAFAAPASGFSATVGFPDLTTVHTLLPISRAEQLNNTLVASAMAPEFIPPGTYIASLCYRGDLNHSAACAVVADVRVSTCAGDGASPSAKSHVTTIVAVSVAAAVALAAIGVLVWLQKKPYTRSRRGSHNSRHACASRHACSR